MADEPPGVGDSIDLSGMTHEVTAVASVAKGWAVWAVSQLPTRAMPTDHAIAWAGVQTVTHSPGRRFSVLLVSSDRDLCDQLRTHLAAAGATHFDCIDPNLAGDGVPELGRDLVLVDLDATAPPIVDEMRRARLVPVVGVADDAHDWPQARVVPKSDLSSVDRFVGNPPSRTA